MGGTDESGPNRVQTMSIPTKRWFGWLTCLQYVMPHKISMAARVSFLHSQGSI
jgi:hypothetical protein